MRKDSRPPRTRPAPAWRRQSGLLAASEKRLLGSLATLYAVSLTALIARDQVFAVPWTFVVQLAVYSAPVAYFVAHGGIFMDRRADSPMYHALAMVCGVALMWLVVPSGVGEPVIAALLALAALALLVRNHAELRTLGVSIVALFLGYAAVWNINYLVADSVAGREKDAALRAADMWVYRALFGPDTDYSGLFPLVRSDFAFRMLENAYFIFFIEVFVLVFVLAARRRDVATFIGTLFSTYLLGMVWFVAYPVLGPYMSYPDVIHSDYHKTAMFWLMQSGYTEYRAVQSGSEVNGFGYFVGLPSLHVAVAILLQSSLRPVPVLFWLWVPINVVVCLATVLLGYHYLLDAVGGVVLIGVVLGGRHALERAAARQRGPRVDVAPAECSEASRS